MPVPAKRLTISDGHRHKLVTDPSEVLSNVIDSIPAFVWTAGPDKECTYFNRAWLDYRGRKLEEELIDGFTCGIHPDDVEHTVEDYVRAFDSRTLYETEYRIKNAEGEYRWVLDRGMPVYRSSSGAFLGYAGTCVDINARKFLEQEISTSKNLLANQNESLKLINDLASVLHENLSVHSIVDQSLHSLKSATNAHDMHFILFNEHNQSHVMTSQNRANCAELNKLQGKQTLQTLGWQVSFWENNQGLEKLRGMLRCQHMASLTGSVVLIPLTHNERYLGMLLLQFDADRAFSEVERNAFQSIGQTISLALSNAHSRLELEFRVNHDDLTGLPNREHLHQLVADRLAKKQSDKHALLLIDLDRFKEINDTLGHYVGDQLLQQIGPSLQPLLDTCDGTLCRLGGDEFTVFIPNVGSATDEEQLARQMLEQLRLPFHIDGFNLEIDASIGIAQYPVHGDNSHALLRCADVAMYEAKEKGLGVALYASHFDKNTPQRLQLISELKRGIKQKQVTLHYQPKISLLDNSIVGYEALARWQHPQQGLLYPDRFMPLAEMSDAIHSLTWSVMEMSLREQVRWYQQGHRFGVAVNLSARNLIDDRCVDKLKYLIENLQCDPEGIELEITETALMHDPQGAIKRLSRIRDLGVCLSIDDFGTGYSSLSYLRKLPLCTLKIDKLFVTHMRTNAQDIAIVRSVVSLAHSLGLKVVAEGVEDTATLTELAELGCDMAQGYVISKPLPWSEHALQLKQDAAK